MELPDGRGGVHARRRHILSDEDQPGGDDPDHAREKIGRRPIVNGHGDHPAEEASPERDDPLRTVFAPEDHFVAFREPELREARSERARGLSDVRVGVPPGAESVVVNEKFAASAGEIIEEVDERVARHV